MAVDDIAQRLLEAEGSGRVEFKRSCLWPLEAELVKVQGVLIRLANGNSETGGLVHLGREDDGTIVGLVDAQLARVADAQKLKAAEQRLVQYAERIDPPMQIRWYAHEVGGKQTIVIEVPGRPLGGWFQDEQGAAKIGSGSHPVIVRQAVLQAWAREVAPPPYQLEVHVVVRGVVWSLATGMSEGVQVLQLDIRNLGSATSYVASINLTVDFDGHVESVVFWENPSQARMPIFNPKLPFAILPGRHQEYSIRLADLLETNVNYVATFHPSWNVDPGQFVLTEVMVCDEIGNQYSETVSEVSQEAIAAVWRECAGTT